ncbi:MAG: RNA polymerase sporulation sigma factor SigK [Clostridia bacterium]|nr:sigma-70 family RNA polymerase sigma factor [Oscillospiraceae bacterium]MBR2407265.1 RNA polymerase sporulation sigma factor SigK [Clostridia bacterium]MBR2445250.1 RNA polymerase sporulation sigma factor SigK [Clostridia bacterium]
MNVFKKWILWIKQKLSRKQGVYYINGPELLPPPYTPEKEAEVIAALEAGDADARNALIEHNLRLVVYIAKKFESTGTGIEDLISIGTIGLCKAVNTFRSDKNIKLATYASRCIENEILMYLRKQSGKGGEVSLDEPLNVDFDGNELLLSDILGSEEDGVAYELEQREEREAIRRAVATLDERERLIIELRYGLSGRDEMTQKEVAAYLGISQSYISRLEKKIIADLRDRMANV